MALSDKEPTCDCPDVKVVKRLLKGGTTRFERQCQTCGKSTPFKATWKDKSEAVEYEKSIAEEWDARRRAFWKLRSEEYNEERERKNREWWERYTAYLKTDLWAKKRELVIARDPTCKACERRPATQAHHLTYKHCPANTFDYAAGEPLFDLIGICKTCHEYLTALDREIRGGGPPQ